MSQKSILKHLSVLFSFGVVVLILSVFNSCSGNKKMKEGYYFEDFDVLRFWNHDVMVTREQAHSGDYAAFTDSSNEFSQAFVMDYGYARSKGFRSITVNAFCRKTSSSATGGLLTSIESAGKKSASILADISVSVKKPDHWEKVTTVLNLPDQAPGDSKIKIALWSPGKYKLYLDDIEIEFKK